MRLGQLTEIISLLTDLRDQLSAFRIDRRVAHVQYMDSLKRRRDELQMRPRTPHPALREDGPLLPEEFVRASQESKRIRRSADEFSHEAPFVLQRPPLRHTRSSGNDAR